jgi:hypothetical protein
MNLKALYELAKNRVSKAVDGNGKPLAVGDRVKYVNSAGESLIGVVASFNGEKATVKITQGPHKGDEFYRHTMDLEKQ